MKKWAISAGVGLVLIFCLLLLARWYVITQVRAALFDWMITFRKSGALIHVKDVHVFFWKSKVCITGLQVVIPKADSARGLTLNVPRLVLQGYQLVPILKSKELLIQNVLVTSPTVCYANLPQTAKGSPVQAALNKLSIGQWVVISATITRLDSISGKPLWKGGMDVDGGNFVWNLTGSSRIKARVGNVQVTKAFLQLEDTYLISARRITYDQAARRIRADSLRINPIGTHGQFIQKVGHQTDEITGGIPLLTIEGIDLFDSLPISRARSVNLGLALNIFRDKRYPDIMVPPHLMPIPFLHALTFPFHVDSINLREANIAYEEVPTSNAPSGTVSFNRLNATILGLSNGSTGEAIMDVQCRFMNVADLNVHFTFPRGVGLFSEVRGSLGRFPLTAINKILRPAANLKVNSGILNEMKFYFRYNSFRSDGELTINYNDL
jgi:hypothetical protein